MSENEIADSLLITEENADDFFRFSGEASEENQSFTENSGKETTNGMDEHESENRQDSDAEAETIPEFPEEDNITSIEELIEEEPVEYSVLYNEPEVFALFKKSLPNGYYRYADQLTGLEKEIYKVLESEDSLAKFHNSGDDSKVTVISETYTFDDPAATAVQKENEFKQYRDTVYSKIRKAMAAYDFDHPEIFWTCGIWYTVAKPEITDSTESMTVLFKAQLPNCWPADRNLASDEARFNSIVESVVSSAKAFGDSPFCQLEYLHNLLITENCYNYDANNKPESTGYIVDNWVVNCSPWSAAGALFSEFSPVCEGYSRAFQIICQNLGILCAPVVGNNHMWNYVKVGNYWYAVDCTWDDTESSDISYRYFLAGNTDNSFGSIHTSGTHYSINFSYPSIAGSTEFGTCGTGAYWKIIDGCLYIYGSGAMNDYTADTQPWNSYVNEITTVSIGKNIKRIGNYAFAGCENASDIFIGNSDITVGMFAFTDCPAISMINISEKTGSCSSNTCWKIIDGCIYIYGNSGLNASQNIYGGSEMNDYTQNSQPWNDYKGEITSISVNKEIAKIGQYAFYNCNNAVDIYLGEGIVTVGKYAFSACSSIDIITIPSTVTCVDSYSFALNKAPNKKITVTFLGECVDSSGNYMIKDNAFDEVYGTAYYSKRDETWTDTRVSYMRSVTTLKWKNLPIPVEGISITNGNTVLLKDSTLQLTVSFYPGDCDYQEDRYILWSAEGDAVSVDDYGTVTALKCGSAVITAVSTENSNASAQTVITVPHQLTHVEAKAKTCTSNGTVEHWKCSVCNKCFSDETASTVISATEIPAAHLKPVTDPAVPATFTSVGFTEGSHCDECHNVIKEQTVIPMLTSSVTFEAPSKFDEAYPVYFDGKEFDSVKNSDGTFTVHFFDDTLYSQMTTYKYNSSGVPTGMSVWTLTRDADYKYTATRISELEDLLTYHGFSIRITGNTGIRFKTGIDVNTREALLSANGLNGWHLEEYGTLNMTDYNYALYPCVKGGEKVSSGRSYYSSGGKTYDYVLETVSGRYRYASVLTPIPVQYYKTAFVFRGYIVLTKGEQTYTFYGPAVYKSMYDLAGQVMRQYESTGGAVYDFAEKIRDDADAYTG